MTADRRWQRDVALVVTAVVAAYANSLWNGFAYDDVGIIERNPVVTGPGSVADVWLGPYWPTGGEYFGLYRPLTIASFALQWTVSGGAAWLFHAVSLIQHALVSVLVLALLRRLASPAAALVGALVFALHPVHTEAVANLVGQAELVSAAAVVGACWIWIARPHARWRLPAVAALYAIGVLAKEHAIVLPALLVLLDAGAGQARPPARYARAMLPALLVLALVASALLALRMAAIGSILGADAGPALPYLRGDGRLLAALRAWPEYARLMLFPLDLSSDYSPAVILPPEEWSAPIVAGAVMLVATVALALATPWRPRLGVPAGWFLITILPVSNLLFPIGVLLAERTLYLPSVAVALAAGFGWDALRERHAADAGSRRALVAAAALLCVGLGLRTILRNPSWRDSGTVARTLYIEHPESYRAQWEAASVLATQGDTTAAADHFRLAYRLWPHDPGLKIAYGEFLIAVGLPAEAMQMLAGARGAAPFRLRAETALGEASMAAGDARAALESADRLDRIPGGADAARSIRLRLSNVPSDSQQP